MAFSKNLSVICCCFLLIGLSFGSHFDSGTISCDNTAGTTVACYWKTGWVLNGGPCCNKCTAASVGSPSPCSAVTWTSISPSLNTTVASAAPYTLTGWNVAENWEEGEDSFTYTFPASGPYTIQHSSCCWRSLNIGGSGYTIQTTLNIGARSDTGNGNNAPRTLSLPVYRQQHNCGTISMTIPMSDADGDNVRCRVAVGAECDGVCNALPSSAVNSSQPNCYLTFNTSAVTVTAGSWFAVALMIEDLPTSTITVGGSTFTPTTPISSVPLQFLVYVPAMSVSCTAYPVFVSPTPAANTVYGVASGGSLTLTIQAQDTSGSPVSTVTVSGPGGGTVSPTTGVSTGSGTSRYVVWSWTPSATQQSGSFTVCFMAADGFGKTTEFRCVNAITGITCPDPGFGTNSARTPAAVQSFGYTTSVTYACNTGYTYSSGDLTRTCQFSKTFNGTAALSCIPITCPDPGFGSNSARSPAASQTFNYTDTVSYTCNSGFKTSTGNATRTCQASGSFDGNVLTCIPITCPDPGMGTAAARSPSTSQVFNIGGTVMYKCNVGYQYSSGDASRTCLNTALFNGTAFVCTIVPCPDPGVGANVIRTPSAATTSFVYQDTVTYVCDVGYMQASGDASRTCQASGSFNGSTFTCDRVPCADPGYGVNANRSVGNVSHVYQDVVSYSCQLGYMYASGDQIRTCQANGLFNGTNFTCDPVPCPDPGYGVFANRSVGNISSVFLDEVEYSCDLGYYHVAGDGNITCQANGTFSGTNSFGGANFTCDPVPCPDPEYGINANRSHFNQSFVYMDTVTFECLPGYLFVEGDGFRNCTYNGTWDGVNTTCVAVAVDTKASPWWPWLLVALGCLLLLVILAVLIYLLCRKKKTKDTKQPPPIYVAPLPPKSTRTRTSLSFTSKILSKVFPAAPATLPAVENVSNHPAPKPVQQKPPGKKTPVEAKPTHPPPAPVVPPVYAATETDKANSLTPTPEPSRTSTPRTSTPSQVVPVIVQPDPMPERPKTEGDVENSRGRPFLAKMKSVVMDATPRYLLPRTKFTKPATPEPKKRKPKTLPKYMEPRTQFTPDDVWTGRIYTNQYPRKYPKDSWVHVKDPPKSIWERNDDWNH